MKKVKDIIKIIIALIISFLIVYFVNDKKDTHDPIIAYRVYLGGESIGLIDSKEALDEYINKQQEKLKEKFKVDKIYIPNEINVVKDITYTDELDSISSVYNKINNISPFTIKGYQVTIDKTNSTVYENDDNMSDGETSKIIKLYVLNKEIFTKAVENVVLSFIDENTYKAFIDNNQVKIETTGELVEDIYIEDIITIRETNIPTNSNIYMDVESLTKYLIFGSNSSDKTYMVKAGDTITKIANNNQMSVNELLIANSNIHSENALLYIGQKLDVGTINPIFNTIVEEHQVIDQTVKYTTQTKYDSSKLKGYSQVTQEGINGVIRVTQKVKSLNGEIIDANILSSEELVPVVNKIIIRGGSSVRRGDGGWVWPTDYPYAISSGYGWRWGKLHTGIDIILTPKCGSQIYAARAGTVVAIKFHATMGYYVTIRHENGYYTQYLHLLNSQGNSVGNLTNSASKYIEVGEYVYAKTVIGEMGNSGHSTGCHLHFEIWDGAPYDSNSYDPRLFY